MWLQFVAEHTGRPVGRLAVLWSAAWAVAGERVQPQYVHADRVGNRRRLRVYSVRGDRLHRSSFPARHAGAMMAWSPVYFEAAAVITVLVLLGQVLGTARSRGRPRGAIKRPAESGAVDMPGALRRRCQRRMTSPLEQASGAGDQPAGIRPGEKRAGRRRDRSRGASAVDESVVTGESLAGDEKSAGAKADRRHTVNQSLARFVMRAAKSRAPTRCWRGSFRWSSEAQRSPRTDPAPSRPSLRLGSCPPVIWRWPLSAFAAWT